MNYTFLTALCLLVSLGGCSDRQEQNNDQADINDLAATASNNAIDVDSTLSALRAEARKQEQLLKEKHKQESTGLSNQITQLNKSTQSRHAKEVADWNKKKENEIADLESQGHKYQSVGSFSNPLKRPPAIVSNLAKQHDNEQREMRSRKGKELGNLRNFSRTEQRHLQSKHSSELDILRQELEKQERAIIRQALKNVLTSPNVDQMVEPEILTVNPYMYEDKIVVIRSRFNSMLSRDVALFTGEMTMVGPKDPFIVTDVPTTRFTEEKKLLLVGLVLGNKRFKMPSGNENLIVHVKYIDAYDSEYSNEDLTWALDNAVSEN